MCVCVWRLCDGEVVDDFGMSGSAARQTIEETHCTDRCKWNQGRITAAAPVTFFPHHPAVFPPVSLSLALSIFLNCVVVGRLSCWMTEQVDTFPTCEPTHTNTIDWVQSNQNKRQLERISFDMSKWIRANIRSKSLRHPNQINPPTRNKKNRKGCCLLINRLNCWNENL